MNGSINQYYAELAKIIPAKHFPELGHIWGHIILRPLTLNQ